ncbi:MAG TPA: hypothetical protein VFI37_03125 [Gaiellaceae bacterium]|nr:hypothetical protein [Gaiellaceae bacterium]
MIKLAAELRENPWLGERMRERFNLRVLGECRRIRFDRPDWTSKPRYRIVYRNEPSDGAPAVARILAIGERERLAAYRSAAARVGSEQRRRRRRI